jgi:Flp pilus assembly pilin Flp
MTEYIIIVGLVAIAAIGVVTVFGDNVRGLFGAAAGALNGEKAERTVHDVGDTAKNVTIQEFDGHIDGK